MSEPRRLATVGSTLAGDPLSEELTRKVRETGEPAVGEGPVAGTGNSGPQRQQIMAVPVAVSGRIRAVLLVRAGAGERDMLAGMLEAVRQIGEAAGAYFEPVALAQIVMAKARELLGADSAGVAWWDGANLQSLSDHLPNNTGSTSGRVGRPVGETRGRGLEPGEGALGIAYSLGQPVVVPGYRSWELRLDDAFGAVIAVPLIIKGRPTGSLIVRYLEQRELPRADVALLALLAGQIAPTLEAARINSDLVEAEINLRETTEANRLKSAFVATMSHELRTPLTAIIGFSDLILEGADGPLNESLLDDISEIKRSGRSLLDLVNDVLDLSKLQEGRMEIEVEPVDVAMAIPSVARQLRALAEAKGLRLEIELEAGELVSRCDAMRTRQVLTNLLSNAIKFTAGGAVTVGAKREGEFIEIYVADTGVGIQAGARETIFDEFVQAESGRTRRFGGIGLGLPIASKLVELQGGSMGVTSTPGRGSRFWFRLPVYVPLSKNDSAEEESAIVAEPQTETAPGPTKDVVLVVDDESGMRELICRRLREMGFATIQACDGEEALRMARSERPAAITLDVQMPKIDGWGVLRHLKSARATREILVVVMTIADGREKALQLGATAYITKPPDTQQLTEVFDRVLPRMAPADVLCIDDDAMTRELMQDSLAQAGVSARVASSGSEALKEVERKIPDAIVLDLSMPEMSGYELILRLRGHPGLDRVPIIVVSGKDLSQRDQLVLSGVVDRIVQKGELSQSGLAATVPQAVGWRSR